MANSHIVLLWETAHHRVKCTTVLYCFSFALPKVILESYGTPKKIEVKIFKMDLLQTFLQTNNFSRLIVVIPIVAGSQFVFLNFKSLIFKDCFQKYLKLSIAL